MFINPRELLEETLTKKKPRKSNQGLLGKTTGRITEKDPEKIPE